MKPEGQETTEGQDRRKRMKGQGRSEDTEKGLKVGQEDRIEE